jgi:hypothetical protein
MSKKRHKNYRKFLEWKAQRDKDNKELFMVSREIKTLDSKYNDYNGQFQGRVLNVEQWGKYGVVSNPDGFGRIMEYPNKRFVLMTEERYYKEFCQLDHMINDRAYMRYCREFVSTSQTTDEGITEHKSIIELWCKVRDITLNGLFEGFPEHQGYSVKSGSHLTAFELDKLKSFRKDYVKFNTDDDDELFHIEGELEDLNDIEEWEYRQELDNFYVEHNDDELPF